ncbi:S49 family peptidase [Ferrimonas kyonanensis]|uniref:S49 family peptidase n=1 Tax=Ferrimonas kyonanensis TaxID=364763 RepID=UPI000400A2F2|nr:S49 family peptidase [Ferrimonas kyonanensis]
MLRNPFKRKATTGQPLEETAIETSQELLRIVRRNFFLKNALIVTALAGAGWSMMNPEHLDTDDDHIAVIQVNGIIGSGNKTGSAQHLIGALKEAVATDSAKGILIMADSPGGSPVEAESVHHWIQDYRHAPTCTEGQMTEGKPNAGENCYATKKAIEVSIGNVCASACYYIASAADRIAASNSSLVGSIGVKFESWDFTKAMDTVGVGRRTLAAGHFKTLFDPYLPMDKQGFEVMRSQVLMPLYAQFTETVTEARLGKLPEDTTDLFSGRVFVAAEARKYGLIDDIDYGVSVLEGMSQRYDVEHHVEYNRVRSSFSSLFFGAVEHFGHAIGEGIAASIQSDPYQIR